MSDERLETTEGCLEMTADNLTAFAMEARTRGDDRTYLGLVAASQVCREAIAEIKDLREQNIKAAMRIGAMEGVR